MPSIPIHSHLLCPRATYFVRPCEHERGRSPRTLSRPAFPSSRESCVSLQELNSTLLRTEAPRRSRGHKQFAFLKRERIPAQTCLGHSARTAHKQGALAHCRCNIAESPCPNRPR